GRMDEVAIDIVELEPPATGVERWLDPLGTMIVVPELRGDKQVVPLDCSFLENLLNGVADGLLIAVALRAIEMAKSRLQCGLGRVAGYEGIRNQRPESEGGDCAGSVGEGYVRMAKCVVGFHGCTLRCRTQRRIRELRSGPRRRPCPFRLQAA